MTTISMLYSQTTGQHEMIIIIYCKAGNMDGAKYYEFSFGGVINWGYVGICFQRQMSRMAVAVDYSRQNIPPSGMSVQSSYI